MLVDPICELTCLVEYWAALSGDKLTGVDQILQSF